MQNQNKEHLIFMNFGVKNFIEKSLEKKNNFDICVL